MQKQIALTERTQILDIPYVRWAGGIRLRQHEKLAAIVDPLAQAVMADLKAQGIAADKMHFGVEMHLQDVDSGAITIVDAVRYEPGYDWDGHQERVSKLTGTARRDEMLGDVTFRIHGKSVGLFRGSQPSLDYEWKYKRSHGKMPGDSVLHAITVRGWRASE